MKILTCMLFLTFVGFLYARRHVPAEVYDHMSLVTDRPPDYRYVVVMTQPQCMLFKELILMSADQLFGPHHNSPRPLWIAARPADNFQQYMVFLEMQGHRYEAPILEEDHYEPHDGQMGFLHIPTQAVVAIGQHTYVTTNFLQHVYGEPTPRPHIRMGYVGLIYLQIKGSKMYYFAYLHDEP